MSSPLRRLTDWAKKGPKRRKCGFTWTRCLKSCGAGSATWRQLVSTTSWITADHGFLFTEGLELGLQMDAPGGNTVELHPRVWIGQGGTNGEGYFRVNASDLELGGPLEFAFPKGLGTFKVKGGVGSYFHGGPTLQENLLPLCRLKFRRPVSVVRGRLSSK